LEIRSLSEALVIGPGAIGVAVADALARQGVAVGFLGRGGPEQVAARLDGEALAFPPANPARAELAFVAVKAFDLASALNWTAELPPGAAVVPLSNGAVAGLVQDAATRRRDLRWRLGFATIGITETAAGIFERRSRTGEVAFGPLPGAAGPTPLEERLAAAGTPFKWHPGILWMHRRKWLYNTVINTLAAARRLPSNGALLALLPELLAVFDEAHRLGAALWGPWPLPRADLYQGMIALIEATADNENSMARDRRLGRRTESAYLAGLAADQARYPQLAALHRALA
jgi:2-dehydropantoate 2-reductase